MDGHQYTYMHIRIHAHIYNHVCVFICKYICANVVTCAYTYTYTGKYIGSLNTCIDICKVYTDISHQLAWLAKWAMLVSNTEQKQIFLCTIIKLLTGLTLRAVHRRILSPFQEISVASILSISQSVRFQWNFATYASGRKCLCLNEMHW